jgi:hypothetical protein
MKKEPDGPGNGGAIAYVQSPGGVLVNCTLVGNSGGPGGLGGVWANGTMIRSVILANTIGNTCFGTPGPTWSCTDLYGNETGDQICGIDGGDNFSEDPQFCDPTFANGNVTIQDESSCAPGNHSPQCDLIGAGAIACGSVAIQKRSWSDVKRLFR